MIDPENLSIEDLAPEYVSDIMMDGFNTDTEKELINLMEWDEWETNIYGEDNPEYDYL